MAEFLMYDPNSPILNSGANKSGSPLAWTSDLSVPAATAKMRFAEDRLLAAVIWCEIAPGALVTEATIMQRFGLTRAAARAGLTRLGYDDWAVPQVRKGWLIRPVTGVLIGQVLDARRNLEPALARVKLCAEAKTELMQIRKMVKPLSECTDSGGISSIKHYSDRVDSVLLEALNPFSAGHLKKLWDHTARITCFLEDASRQMIFRRRDTAELINAIIAEDEAAICASRNALIEDQQAFFLEQLLKIDAPLTPGSGIIGQSNQAAIYRSEI